MPGAVLLHTQPQEGGDLPAKFSVAHALNDASKLAKHQHQRHHPRVAKLQSRRSLTVFGHGRLHHTLDAAGAQATVLADTLDFQQALVDLVAQFLERRQIFYPFIDAEIPRIVEGALGAQASAFLVILFEVKMFVADVQTGMHPLAQDAVRKLPGVVRMILRGKINCTRSGRPKSRLSRMTSSKNCRPATGRSMIWVRLTSNWRTESL